MVLFLIIFFIDSLNLETKIDYLLKRQKQYTIFDYFLNSQKLCAKFWLFIK